jgi:coproporphyrinogen III oxidase
MTMKNKFYQYIQNLQDQIVAGLEAVEELNSAKTFGNVQKAAEERVIENGNVIERCKHFGSSRYHRSSKMFNVGGSRRFVD